ncbi:hypothetical protein VP1G_11055 [Cytospora mali]|uniref:Uncharacterized protein n=1 Tax=Cytospora mali TaxID=578113 RepID=A0A194V564_CYTMA|nr:hypothetical protein VP1G_11055 [Valsa mali var. pyri (nom. inval.)]
MWVGAKGQESIQNKIHSSSNATLGTDLPRLDSDAQVGQDIYRDLDLGTALGAPDGGFGQGGSDLPHLLALLLLLLLVGVEVGVILVVVLDLGLLAVLAVLGGLGLGLGDVDVGVALGDLDQDVAAVLGGLDVHGAAGGDGRLGGDDGGEDLGAVLGEGDNTDGVGDVGHRRDGGVGALLDILDLELLDQAGLQGGAAGLQLGGVDGGGRGGGREDGGGLGEDGAHVGGDAGRVRGAAGQDDLVDVQDVQAGLLDDALDEAVEALKDWSCDHLVAESVDGGGEVDTVGERLDAEAGVGSQAQCPLGGLGLHLELRERPRVLPGVGLVLLDELLGEVVHQDLVQGESSELVVVGRGQDGVHATAARNNGNVRACATEVGHHDDLDLNVGIVGGLDQGLPLGLAKVGGHGDDGGSHLLAEVVGSGLCETAQVAGRDLGDADFGGGGVLLRLLLDAEGDGGARLFGVGGGVVVGWVNGLEAVRVVSSLLWGGIIVCPTGVPYSLPRKSLKYAIVFVGFLMMKFFAWPP